MFWWLMLVCGLLTPLLMIVCGRMMWKRPPKSINGSLGYRTARSMKNMETWKFAHDSCGRLWWKIGWIILLPSAAIYVPVYGSSEDVIGALSAVLLTIQCVILIVTIIPTERALKRNFGDEGTRR